MDFTGDHQSEKTIFSIDPGREKVGVAILSLQGEVLFHNVLPEEEIEKEIKMLKKTV